jgi:hypothetical protein
LVKERAIIKEKEDRIQRALEELESKLQRETEEFRSKQNPTRSSATDAGNANSQLNKFEEKAKELGEKSAVLRMQRTQLMQQREGVRHAIDQLQTQAKQFDEEVMQQERPVSAGGTVQSSRPSIFSQVARNTLATPPTDAKARKDMVADLAARHTADIERLKRMKDALRRPDSALMGVEQVEDEIEVMVGKKPAIQDGEINTAVQTHSEGDELEAMLAAASKPAFKPQAQLDTGPPALVRRASLAPPNAGSNQSGAMPSVPTGSRRSVVTYDEGEDQSSAPLKSIPASSRRQVVAPNSQSVTSWDSANDPPGNSTHTSGSTRLPSNQLSRDSRPALPMLNTPHEPTFSVGQFPQPRNPSHHAAASEPSNFPAQQHNDPGLDGLLQEIAVLKNEYARTGSNRSDLLATIQAMEYEVQGIRARKVASESHSSAAFGAFGAQIAAPPIAPFASVASPFGQNPSMMNPMMMQLQQQMLATQKLLQSQEQENQKLQQEMERLARAKEADRAQEQRMAMERQMMLLTRSLAGGNPVGVSGSGGSGGAGGEMFGVSSGALDVLNALPRDSELHRLQMDHLMSMSKAKFEVEMFEQQMRMQKLRADSERQMLEEHAAREHALAVQQQKRQLELARLQQLMPQTIAPNGPFQIDGSAAPQLPTFGSLPSAPTVIYDPVAGFVLFFDHVTGLPVKNERITFVYQLVDGTAAKTKPRDGPIKDTDIIDAKAANKLRRTALGVKRQFAKVPVLSNLKLLTEVQAVTAPAASADARPSTVGIGWSLLEIFSPNGQLREGKWRLNVYKPPMNKAATSFSLTQQSDQLVPGVELYVRVVRAAIADSEPIDVDLNALSSYQGFSEPAAAAPLASTAGMGSPLSSSLPPAHNAAQAQNTGDASKVGQVFEENGPAESFDVPQDVVQPSDVAVAAPAEEKQEDDDDLGVGILLEKMEASSSNPFSRIRVTVYNGDVVHIDPASQVRHLKNKIQWNPLSKNLLVTPFFLSL